MIGKEAHAGVQVQGDPAVEVAGHGLDQLANQITIDLEERSSADAKRFLAYLIVE